MYNHQEIEKKWIKYWKENEIFKTDIWDFSKPKYYVLDMFPYTSGQGLHVGHPEGYTATDIVSRMKRMQGYNVLHPMGFDSFGLPSEQYAINTGNHPEKFTLENIDKFKKQLEKLGFDFDWSKEVITCDPKFYKWTQWIFKNMYSDGLAHYKDMPVNWCEELGTVLANDEIINGKSERGGFPVIRKKMKQWIMDIPKYADSLLDGLDSIDWPESTKEIQRNWIGKSKGAIVKFAISDHSECFEVFTTRPDTLFGVTYCVLAPEHELVKKIVSEAQKGYVNDYVKTTSMKSEFERAELTKEKSGIWTGAFAINPVNNTKIPIWISDYVISSYGTGAIMAVPAHDERDYEFAKKFNLDILPVVSGGNIEKEAYTKDGILINSDFLNGLNKKEAIDKMIQYITKNEFGKAETTYRLREWIFARQRYWGEPIPISYLEDGTIKSLPDKELPLILPEMSDYKSKDGNPPLDNAVEWKNYCIDGKKAVRETSTMPGSAGSSWYFLRYIDPTNEKEIANQELLKHWMPVDLYMGGSEHAVGHLLYSRFWNQYLFDKKIVPTKEPFKKLVHQGMILGENNEKMSKSKGNVVNPDDVIKSHGADSLRLYLMFMGPIEATKPWNTNGLDGSKKFIDKLWKMYTSDIILKKPNNNNLEKIYNQTVKKVTHDYEKMAFNTAISQIMIFINAVQKENSFPIDYAKGILKLLNPIIPFVTEEIWQTVFKSDSTIAFENWPTYDEEKTIDDTLVIGVQVNGKLRGEISVLKDASKEELLKLAKENENVLKYITEKEIVKEIAVPGKIVNIVVK